MSKIFDANGKEIKTGRVRYATWGMFDVLSKDKEKSGRKDSDPKYVTHVNFGIVRAIFDDENGTLNITPDGVDDVIHLCTKPSWRARPEFVEIVEVENELCMGL